MQKAIATYSAPDGDNKVCEMGGVTFYSGQPVELNSDDHDHLIMKLRGNQHFVIDVDDDDGKPKRGRPRTRDLKAAISEAVDHDFEADRRGE